MRKIVLSKIFLIIVLVMVSGCSNPNMDSNKDSSNQRAKSTNEGTKTVTEITSFNDLNTNKVKLIALGNSDVPVGQYSQEILENLGFWDKIQNKISFASNVKEVLSQVKEGSVDCGIVYETDAKTSNGIKVVSAAPRDLIKTPVLYPIAMIKSTKNAEASKVFLNYIQTEAVLKKFEAVGFKVLINNFTSDIMYSGGDCTLTIFAASSLTESLKEIQTSFQEKYPKIKLTFNFASSGTLQKQIESGAEADIFISAAQKQMTELMDKGYVVASNKFDLLENKVVLITPEK